MLCATQDDRYGRTASLDIACQRRRGDTAQEAPAIPHEEAAIQARRTIQRKAAIIDSPGQAHDR